MNSEIKDSNKAHERHDSTGVTVAKVTWKSCESKARDEKVEGGSEALMYGRQNSGNEEKGSVGFHASSVKEYFKSRLGLAST